MALPILIVDDAQGIRQLLADVLEDVGFEVIAARGGQEALDIVDHQGVDLIVTDVQMPVLDGPEFCRALAKRGITIPVVVMSSANAVDVAREVGAVGYLDKPFTVYQARATIEAALEHAGAHGASLVRVAQERALRVFVLTSQRFLAEMIKLTLNHGVYVTRAGHTIEESTAILRDWRPHLAVLDLDSGGEQFLEHLRENREDGSRRIPIVALTRNRDLKTKLDAFDLGVDDVLIVPISPEELLARVLALTRRTFGQTFPLKPVVRLGLLEIDILNHRVLIGSNRADLTETERSLLYLLAANAGEVLTYDEILATIWGADFPAESDLIDRHVQSLRSKLQNGWPATQFIAAVPGKGYSFEAAVLDLGAGPKPVATILVNTSTNGSTP